MSFSYSPERGFPRKVLPDILCLQQKVKYFNEVDVKDSHLLATDAVFQENVTACLVSAAVDSPWSLQSLCPFS